MINFHNGLRMIKFLSISFFLNLQNLKMVMMTMRMMILLMICLKKREKGMVKSMYASFFHILCFFANRELKKLMINNNSHIYLGTMNKRVFSMMK